MSKYVTRFSHFTFRKDGSSLVVTSERSSGFEEIYAWRDEWNDLDKNERNSAIYSEYYLRAKSDYRDYKS
ncbi:hypothetical protein M199_gp267 [Halogranum tailed virus 1]|uniref:Uncharacterized protein n=1 Tax=Halogranum tailed virus 1 TaxID=1273749 RepID=R4T6U2_9CAUD|nr:hypothetical protein M199_gp267 [Halogranum tailed virus 1]AGM11399.1 hypothetical protein HGTV1_97 [Halogranum tailed virus 1]